MVVFGHWFLWAFIAVFTFVIAAALVTAPPWPPSHHELTSN